VEPQVKPLLGLREPLVPVLLLRVARPFGVLWLDEAIAAEPLFAVLFGVLLTVARLIVVPLGVENRHLRWVPSVASLGATGREQTRNADTLAAGCDHSLPAIQQQSRRRTSGAAHLESPDEQKLRSQKKIKMSPVSFCYSSSNPPPL
jgi:hypothetical protein